VKAAADVGRPVYLRFGKAPLFDLPRGEPFRFGVARTLRQGSDVCFIATGETVIHAVLAAEHLAAEAGLNCRVLSMPTVKPLDEAAVLRAATECRAVITVEEHLVHGGLGDACAAVILQAAKAVRFRCVGIPDEYTVTGSQADIFRHYGITMEGLALTARQLLGSPAAI
jgi:transketolase